VKAIIKRELRTYFFSPIGYVFVGAMFFFSGYYFFTYNLYGNTTDMTTLYRLLFTVVLFLTPVLTMRLLSEEKRSKNDQLLFTAPVSRAAIVVGKYFAALVVYVAAIASTLIQASVVAMFSRADWPVICGNFLGLLLLGCMVIAICLFVSSLTESQVIAAVCGFGISLFLMLVDALALVVKSPVLQAFFRALSIDARYAPFTMGILNFANAAFFLSVSALFLCFTVAGLERRRWS